jgi:TolA-binding protein
MSTVGKVLVIAQIAFSVLLMAFAAGVSSVQTNWKQREQTARNELSKTKKDMDVAQQELQKVRTAQVASEKTLKDAADKARGDADAASGRNKQLQAQLTQTRTELENMRAEAEIAGQEARARRDEAVSMREINAQLHQSRDELITRNREQTDKIVSLDQAAKAMVEKHTKLLNNYAILEKFIRIKGFDADPKELAGLAEPPPVVEGVVLNTKKGGRNGSELVEIGIGSDVGLAKGHKLFVWRADGKGKYLGTIRLDMVDYRTAVGVVIDSSKNGEIQRGDNVTTKL